MPQKAPPSPSLRVWVPYWALLLLSFSTSVSGAACSGDTLHLGIRDVGLKLSLRELIVAQDGAPSEVGAATTPAGKISRISCSSSGGLSCSPPNGLSVSSDEAGKLAFRATDAVPPGSYEDFTILADIAGKTVSQVLGITVAAVAKVHSGTDVDAGIGGTLHQYMSTSFQPAEWQYRFFDKRSDPNTSRAARLMELHPQHVLVQLMDGGAIPWKRQSSPEDPTDWDFTKLDAIVQPLLEIGDSSPELQIAVPPPIPDRSSSSDFNLKAGPHRRTFVEYCQHLVSYYNGPGFEWGGKHFRSASSRPILWWGILSEPDLKDMTAEDYADLYDEVVTALLYVDGSLKFSALEMADPATAEPLYPNTWAGPFSDSVKKQVDAVGLHLYATVDRETTDKKIFDQIPEFARDVRKLRDRLSTTSLSNAQIRITQNNVNGDAPRPDGNSTSKQRTAFKNDERGTHPFFAAYRPYLYAQLAKAGSDALYHWEYTAGRCEEVGPYCANVDGGTTDRQNSEVDYDTGQPYLGYWVDQALRQAFPFTDESEPDHILKTEVTDGGALEVLASQRTDGTVVVMVVNHAVTHPETTNETLADNDGTGDARTVIVDISELTRSVRFASASRLVIDAGTLGEQSASEPVAVEDRIAVALSGYGVGFLIFRP